MSDILNYEPLKELLDIYSDKNKVFLEYLNNDVLQELDGCIYYEDNIDQLFIFDKIYCIDKSTLKIVYSGQIVHLSRSDINMKIKSKYFIRISPDDYYIFYKRKIKKNSKKEFMVSLLKLL